jgi:GTP cyclohydrolase I
MKSSLWETAIKTELDNLKLGKSRHFVKTPKRAVKAFTEMTQFHRKPKKINKHFVFFPAPLKSGLVIVSPIMFSSLCAHHLLPFFGFVNIGYLPRKKILGLSKFKRIVDLFTKQATVQEELTQEIFDLFQKKLQPKGLIVTMSATHTCMNSRGAKDSQSTCKTVAQSTFFQKHPEIVNSFWRLA